MPVIQLKVYLSPIKKVKILILKSRYNQFLTLHAELYRSAKICFFIFHIYVLSAECQSSLQLFIFFPNLILQNKAHISLGQSC